MYIHTSCTQNSLANLGGLGLDAPISLVKHVLILLVVSLDVLQDGHDTQVSTCVSEGVHVLVCTFISSLARREGGRGRHSNWQKLLICIGLR